MFPPQKPEGSGSVQVDLRVPASGQFSRLDPSLAGIEDDLGEAIDQTAGFTDPDMALIIALKWNLLNYAAEEMSETWREQRQQKTAATQQQALAILKDKHDALKAATELQGQIKVRSSGIQGGICCSVPPMLPAGCTPAQCNQLHRPDLCLPCCCTRTGHLLTTCAQFR